MESTTVYVVTSNESYSTYGIDCEKCGFKPFGIQVFASKESAYLALSNHYNREFCDDLSCLAANDFRLKVLEVQIKP